MNVFLIVQLLFIIFHLFIFCSSPISDPKKTTYKKTASEEIFDAILRDDKENTPLAFTWARWVRVTCPPFYHLLMARRAQKTAPQLEINQRY